MPPLNDAQTQTMTKLLKPGVEDLLDVVEDARPRPEDAALFATLGVTIQILIAKAVKRWPQLRAKKGDKFFIEMMGTMAVTMGLKLAECIDAADEDSNEF